MNPLHVTSINSLHVVLEHFPYREYDTTETKRSMCNCVMETKQSDLSNKVRMMEPVWTKSNIVRHKPIFRVDIQWMKKEWYDDNQCWFFGYGASLRCFTLILCPSRQFYAFYANFRCSLRILNAYISEAHLCLYLRLSQVWFGWYGYHPWQCADPFKRSWFFVVLVM